MGWRRSTRRRSGLLRSGRGEVLGDRAGCKVGVDGAPDIREHEKAEGDPHRPLAETPGEKIVQDPDQLRDQARRRC